MRKFWDFMGNKFLLVLGALLIATDVYAQAGGGLKTFITSTVLSGGPIKTLIDVCIAGYGVYHIISKWNEVADGGKWLTLGIQFGLFVGLAVYWTDIVGFFLGLTGA